MSASKLKIRVNDPDIVDKSIKVLAGVLYQRGGRVVDVVREPLQKDGEFHPVGTPSIRREVPVSRLREIIGNLITYTQKDKATGEEKAVAVPGYVVNNILARGEWSHIPPLIGIAFFPIIGPSGELICTDGYNAETQLYCEIDSDIEIAESPTQDDAVDAMKTLEGLVTDFPFQSRSDAMTWIALLLTILARPAINGPVPLFLLQAPGPGAGKTLLARLAGYIAQGNDVPCMVAPAEATEWDKRIMSVALDGRPYFIVDNITTTLRSDSLDMVLTSTVYTGRVLGKSESPTLPWRAVMAATLNNAAISSDIARRALQVKLDPKTERPEQRDGFKHEDIMKHVEEHRDTYLGAALTVLRAFFANGQPKQKMRAMGSYERWSAVVRSALLFAGGEDPITTQDELREEADVDRENQATLINAWHSAYGSEPRLLSQVVNDLGADQYDPRLKDLGFAVSVACGTRHNSAPDPKTLGYRLRSLKGQIVGGLCLTSKRSKAGQLWSCASTQG